MSLFDHLLTLWYNLPVFIRQNLQFKIYLIEQTGDSIFNRAKLLNIGFHLASQESGVSWDCYFFHDVDLLIENDRNIYSCRDLNVDQNSKEDSKNSKSQQKIAKHYLHAWSKYNYRLKYSHFFGGITAINKNTMIEINGLSNNYWGWGREDDDFYHRIIDNGYKVIRPDKKLARYFMIPHKYKGGWEGNIDRSDRRRLQKKVREMRKKIYAKQMENKVGRDAREEKMFDGLTSLKYELIKREVYGLFERISVEIVGDQFQLI